MFSYMESPAIHGIRRDALLDIELNDPIYSKTVRMGQIVANSFHRFRPFYQRVIFRHVGGAKVR